MFQAYSYSVMASICTHVATEIIPEDDPAGGELAPSS